MRLANVYGRSAVTRQLEVGRRHVPMFQDSELAESMQQALDRVDERLEEVFGPGGLPKDEQRRIRFDLTTCSPRANPSRLKMDMLRVEWLTETRF